VKITLVRRADPPRPDAARRRIVAADRGHAEPAAERARLRSAYRAIPGVRVPADGETIEL